MIESLENGLQIAVYAVCLIVSVVRALRTEERAWVVLAFFYGVLALGDLYLEVFLIFVERSPVFYISEFSWYASYLFLFLLLRQAMPHEAWRKRRALPWLCVAFTVGMGAFYLQWGDPVGNLVCALLMGLLMFYSVWGLLWLRGEADRRQTLLCAAVLTFCAMEYVTWTLSCFFRNDSLLNPYFWADTLTGLSTVLLLPGVRKAVAA
jgi:hypothetical protein